MLYDAPIMSNTTKTHYRSTFPVTMHDTGARITRWSHPGEIAIGVIIGRASEYFDFFVYGIASVLVFPAVFFPFGRRSKARCTPSRSSPSRSSRARSASIAFMAIQRRFGREHQADAGAVPARHLHRGHRLPARLRAASGSASIVLLSVFRVGQGIALGGSWDGLPSLLALNAPENRRGWYAMMGQLGAPVGFMIASGLFAFLYSQPVAEDFLDWGWRYPFYVAFAINVVALFARLRLVATHEYARLLDERELEPTNVIEMARAQGST